MKQKSLIFVLALFLTVGVLGIMGNRVVLAECDASSCDECDEEDCLPECCVWADDVCSEKIISASVESDPGTAVYVPKVKYIKNFSLTALIVNLLNTALGLLGFIAVVIILYGGFQWMTSAGSDSNIGTAKKTISAGIIGLAIILSAWAISNFVFNVFGLTTTPIETEATEE
jgi:hypothetical protein